MTAIIKRILILMLLLAGPRALAQSCENEDWFNEFKNEDSNFRYYLGRGTVNAGDLGSSREAYQDALEQAMRANFGSEVNYETTGLTGLKDDEMYKTSQEKFPNVRLNGFEQQKFCVSNGKILNVLYRYKKSAISTEQARLSALALKGAIPGRGAPSLMTGGDYQTSLELLTTFTGAKVFIDDEPFGRAPIRIIGQLAPGPHELRIEHPRAMPFHQKFFLNGQLKIKLPLVEALGSISLQITGGTEKVEILIDGVSKGRHREFHKGLKAGVPYRFTFVSPEIEPLIKTIMVEPREEQTLQIELTLVPGSLEITRVNTNENLRMNLVQLNGPYNENKDFDKKRLEIAPGEYEVSLFSNGEEVFSQKFKVRSRERKKLDGSEVAKKLKELAQRKPAAVEGEAAAAPEESRGSATDEPRGPVADFSHGYWGFTGQSSNFDLGLPSGGFSIYTLSEPRAWLKFSVDLTFLFGSRDILPDQRLTLSEFQWGLSFGLPLKLITSYVQIGPEVGVNLIQMLITTGQSKDATTSALQGQGGVKLLVFLEKNVVMTFFCKQGTNVFKLKARPNYGGALLWGF